MNSLRISVTGRCDLRCRYCHNEGQGYDGAREMTPAEVGEIVGMARDMGIARVKLTGGEPLMRPDIPEIVAACAEHMDEVSMTTNGTRLAEMAAALRDAGLDRVNVSLDTLDPAGYREITGADKVADVLAGITVAVNAGLNPVKVNMVAMPGSAVEGMMADARAIWRMGAQPQIIEMVSHADDYYRLDDLEDYLKGAAVRTEHRPLHRRRIYILADGDGEERRVELVRPMHNSEFCANCTRLRLTADGRLKPCLMHDRGMVDILTPLRRGDIGELPDLFREATANRHPYWTEERR